MEQGNGRPQQPGRVQAWRHVVAHGQLPAGDYDREALAADLAAHALQRLVVALDAPLEEEPPGAERLRRVLAAWLDLARATAPVRRVLEDRAAGRARRLLDQHDEVLLCLVQEDLTALGADEPRRSAQALLREAAEVTAREEQAGRVLRRERAALLAPRVPGPRRSLLRRRAPVPA